MCYKKKLVTLTLSYYEFSILLKSQWIRFGFQQTKPQTKLEYLNVFTIKEADIKYIKFNGIK